MSEKVYAYKARNRKGKVVKGTITANSKASAVKRVTSMSYTIISLDEYDNTGLNKEINLGFKRSAKIKDLAIATRQLASMLSAGLPLLVALTGVIDQTENKPLKEQLIIVRKEIEEGSSFSEALAKAGSFFPVIMIGMVKVGEEGGFLDDSLKALAKNFEDDVALRGKIRSAMSYPLIVLAMALVGVAVILLFVVPVFQEMFASMGEELPLPTRILVNLSNIAPIMVPIVFILALLLFIFWPKLKEIHTVRQAIDPMKLQFPVVGKVYHKILISRFAKNMSSMLNSGVPLMQALDIAEETSGNLVLEKALKNVKEAVKNGRNLNVPMKKQEIFPPMMTQMIGVGEESGTLDEMFISVSNYYDEEVKQTTDKLTSIIEPLLIVGVGILIGGMVIALYLPMFSMYSNLNENS